MSHKFKEFKHIFWHDFILATEKHKSLLSLNYLNGTNIADIT